MLIINHLGAQLIKTEICSELSGALPPANAPALLLAGGVGRETQTKPKSKPKPKPNQTQIRAEPGRVFRVFGYRTLLLHLHFGCPMAQTGDTAPWGQSRGGARAQLGKAWMGRGMENGHGHLGMGK